MRKYLMTALAAVAFGAAFVSCTHSDDVYSPDPTPDPVNEQKAIELAKSEYAALFERTFGKVGKDVDWGFGSNVASTRAMTINGDTYDVFNAVTSEEIAAAFPTAIPGDADEAPTNGDYNYYFNNGANHNYKITASGEYAIGGSWMNTGWDGNAQKTVVSLYNVYVSVDGNVTLKRNGDAHFNLYILRGNVTLDSSFGEMSGTTSVASGATLNDNRDHIACNYGIKLFNRGTVNVGAYKIGNNAKIYNEGAFTATGALEYNSGAGNTSYFYNLGDDVELTAPSMTLNSTCNFISDGTVNISGETKVTKDGIVWVNNGHYTTGTMTFSAKNSTFYNYCNLIVTGLLHMYDGEFNLMANSYTQAATAEFDNFIVNMADNSGFNVDGNTKWEAQGDGTYQGFKATGSNAYVRLGGTTTVAGHKNSLELTGKITYAINSINDLGANDSGVQPTYVFNSGTIEKPFDKVSVTPNDNSCGATWIIDGGDPKVYRIICEDLEVGDEATDFDFNDVIFDVIPNTDASGKVTTTGATIKLICAGGIYELTVDGVEVHEKFDASLVGTENGKYPMINTGKGPNLPEVTFTTTKDCSTPAKINQNIKIIVKKPKYPTGIELTAVKAEAACKILVDDTYGKLSENVSVKTAYPNFVPYVNGTLARTDGKWWIND